MRLLPPILTCLALLIVAGCERSKTELLLVKPVSPLDTEILQDVVDLLGHDADVPLVFTENSVSEESALDMLIAGEADVALVSNSMPYRRGISTVMAMFPSVLHVGYIGEREAETGVEFFRDARIFAGPIGSSSRILFERFISGTDLKAHEYSLVDDFGDVADVFVVFAPIAPERLAMYPGVTLISSGTPDDIGKGSQIDATTLMNPHLRPFIIPVGTYGDATPTAILTLAVDMMLVARGDLDASVVYDLVRELNRLRPALASLRPGVFGHLSDKFEPDNSTFVLHPGLNAYIDRNEPTIYERYSGIAEVVVTITVALISAGFAGIRIYHMRRKNRIDTFYTDVIAIRNSLGDASTAEDRAAAAEKIRDLQNTAFELLVDEKLSADESFRIFISLSNDALRDLDAMNVDLRAS